MSEVSNSTVKRLWGQKSCFIYVYQFWVRELKEKPWGQKRSGLGWENSKKGVKLRKVIYFFCLSGLGQRVK